MRNRQKFTNVRISRGYEWIRPVEHPRCTLFLYSIVLTCKFLHGNNGSHVSKNCFLIIWYCFCFMANLQKFLKETSLYVLANGFLIFVCCLEKKTDHVTSWESLLLCFVSPRLRSLMIFVNRLVIFVSRLDLAAKSSTCESNCYKYLPFLNLADAEFNAVIGNWRWYFDTDLDLFNILPNPDKFDDKDPDK